MVQKKRRNKDKAGSSPALRRRKRVLEQKPMAFERLTTEFTYFYQLALANLRDRKMHEVQKAYAEMSKRYQDIEASSVPKEQKQLAYQQTRDIYDLLPKSLLE